MTQLEAARAGLVTPEMRRVAERECASPELIRDEVARGRLVIPANVRHLAGSGGHAPVTASERGYPGAVAVYWVNQTVAQRRGAIQDPDVLRGERAPKRLDPTGIGRMITTKVNANIGASPVSSSTAEEVEKLQWAQQYGADTLMDLSTGGDLAACRQAIIDHATIPIGTVPIYSMIVGRRIEDLTYDVILAEIERQARQGVDYFTIHAGVLREHLPLVGPRVTDVFPGYDHITSAIGATEAARAGAAMLCYVTPKEHVGLPRAEDVKAGCIAYKIAAHAGDVARGIARARDWDDDLSRARAALNWPRQFELAFDGETARALHDEDLEVDTDFCAMCGHDWCSMRISKEIQEFASGKDAAFQPERRATPSPGAGDAGREP